MGLTININGSTVKIGFPAVMGILNITPDSFYDGGFYPTMDAQLKQVERMLNEGAAIIDIGAVSTRPGAAQVSEDEELSKLLPVVDAVKKYFPDCIASIDTYRSAVAGIAVDHGASIINDIYGGGFDRKMIDLVVSKNVPVILMHMQGTPETMQAAPHYYDVVAEIHDFFKERISNFPPGYKSLMIDPGFGFGKTVEHNFRLLANLKRFRDLGYPIVAGLSRKSMINKVLRIKPEEALNGTTALNTIALLNGADILRVHDVKEAIESVKLVQAFRTQGILPGFTP